MRRAPQLPPADLEAVTAAWARVQAAAGTSKVEGTESWEERARLEAEPYMDGRKLRATGRTKQLNIKVKPGFDAELRKLAKAQGVGLAEMLERILAEWKALGSKDEVGRA